MARIVEVPSLGNVEFPDSMSDADVSAAIKKQLAPAKASLLDNIGDTFSQYWEQVKPTAQAAGAVAPILHPIETLENYSKQQGDLVQKAKDSFKNGQYSEGVRHSLSYFLNGIPGVGALLDQAGNKAGAGDYKGAIADTAALATMIGEGRLVGPAAEGATNAVQAVKNTGAAIKEAVTTPGTARITLGAAETAAGAAGMAHGLVTLSPWSAVGGGYAVERGMRSLKRGLAERRASKALAESAAPKTPAPAAEPPTPTAEVPAAEPVAPNATEPMISAESEQLDAIARSLAGRNFKNLSAERQKTVQDISGKIGLAAPETPQVPSMPVGVPQTPPAAAAAPEATLGPEQGPAEQIPFSSARYVKKNQAEGRASLEPEGFKANARDVRATGAKKLSAALNEAGRSPQSLREALTTSTGEMDLDRLEPLAREAGVDLPKTKMAREKFLEETFFNLRKIRYGSGVAAQ